MPNAKLTLDVGRQKSLHAEITFDYTHIADNGVAVPAIKLPYGAQVVGGALTVDTAFNPGTSLALAVGDAVTGTRYAAAVDLKTVARTALTLTSFVSDGNPVLVTPTLVGAAATAGKARLQVSYIIKNRAEEVQP